MRQRLLLPQFIASLSVILRRDPSRAVGARRLLWGLALLLLGSDAHAQEARVAFIDSVRVHTSDDYNGILSYSNRYLMTGDLVYVLEEEAHPLTGETWANVKVNLESGLSYYVRAKFLARPGDDLQAARQQLQRAEEQRYEEARDVLQIESATTERGGSCSVHLTLRFKNTSPLTVKYAYFTVKFYNAVGDGVIDDITDATYKNLRVTGPIEPNRERARTYYWEYVFWDCAVAYPKLTKAAFSFMEGSSEGHADEYFFYERLGYVQGIPPRFDEVATAIEHEAPVLASLALEPAYPNPFNSGTTLRLQLGDGQPVTVSLYDALGRRADILHEGALPAGTHLIDVAPSGLANGIYFVVARGDRATVVQSITLAK